MGAGPGLGSPRRTRPLSVPWATAVSPLSLLLLTRAVGTASAECGWHRGLKMLAQESTEDTNPAGEAAAPGAAAAHVPPG